MLWTHPIAVAAMLVTAPSPTLDTRPGEWPEVVPRLASYTEEQKAAITDMVVTYCTETPHPKRTELQEKILPLLTPDQTVEAIRYWLPQDIKRDLFAMRWKHPMPEPIDACGRVRPNS